MRATLLFLLSIVVQTSSSSRASVTVSSIYAQYIEYTSVILSCEQLGSADWTVWRYTTNNLVLSQCGSGWGSQTGSTCEITTAKKSDTGVYWCESKYRDSSNTVNITVTGGSVVLQSPALPVMEGHDVTLTCTTKSEIKEQSSPSDLTTTFYKDGSLIRTEPTGHMTIRNFSRSHEGLYKCQRSSDGESPSSWLLMKDDSVPASLTTKWSHLLEYDDLDLNCGDNSSSHGWRIIRASTSGDRKMKSCEEWGTTTHYGCFRPTAKKPDSGIYWCESPARQRSNSVNITVYGISAVILQSPALPVMTGDNVTLTCRTKTPPSNLTAAFYKDGSLIRTEPTGHMTIVHVSKDDEGFYTCHQFSSRGESSPSWLGVKDPDGASSSSSVTGTGLTVLLTVLRRLVVVFPFCIPTVHIVSFYRNRPTGRKPPDDDEGLDQPYDDAIADVTTEHHF